VGIDFYIIGSEAFPFTGVFDGNGHTISNFRYTSTLYRTEGIGLFGYVDGPNAEIRDLGLIAPNISGRNDVGSLVGQLGYGTVSGCYAEGGSVWGRNYVGGLVGKNSGRATITNCYAQGGSVMGTGFVVGGLVGSNLGTITDCYATGSVFGNTNVGGLLGSNYGTITNCYSAGSVMGDDNVGGLVGTNSYGTIADCYSTSSVVGIEHVGGLVGSGGRAHNSFWDVQTSGQSTSVGGKGRTTAQMQIASTFLGWNGRGNEGVWTIDEGNDYPRLWWENKQGEVIETQQLSNLLTGAGTQDDPYLIYTAEELNVIGLFPFEWDKQFRLISDIDLSNYVGTEFNIIGIPNPFSGVFDGNGKKITNLNHTNGLFVSVSGAIRDLGLIDANVDTGTGYRVGSLVDNLQGGTISNCYAEGGSVLGGSDVGGLVGALNRGATITNCYATGSVLGERTVGGLVGRNSGTITNCYSSGDVSGDDSVGGLVGYNYDTITNCYSSGDVSASGDYAYSGVGGLVGENSWGGTITNCYSSGGVTGTTNVGGLVGRNYDTITNCYATGSVLASGTEWQPGVGGGLVGENRGEVTHSFWDTQTSGQVTSDGGTGKTTAEMQTESTFTDAGWDFTTPVWTIDEGMDYPRLWWDAETGQEIRTFRGHTGQVRSVAFSPDGTRVLTGSSDETAKLWDAETGQEIRTFLGHTGWVVSVAFSPDGKRVLTGSWDGTAKLWDAETGQEIRTFRGHASWVFSVAFSPDGKRVLTGSWDSTAKLWDAETGQDIRTFRGHMGQVDSVAFSPDGKRVLTGSGDETAKLWDAETGQEIRTFLGHTSWVRSVAFSPDGTRVLTGSWDSTAKLWDAETGQEIRTFRGHTGRVFSVAFSPDGTRVLTGGRDYTAKLWDAETGQEIRTFRGHTGRVFSVAFSPDGTRVLTGSRDSTARLWDAENWLQPLQPVPPPPPLPPPPPKGRGCFLADTSVWVNGALVQISNVVSGQMVGKPHCGLATECLEQIETVEEHEGTFECRDIVLESGNRISVVDAHCFMLDSGQWIAAQDLRSGLRLKTLSGTVGIKSVATRAAPFVGKVYNLKVTGVDWYLVSEDGVIVRDY
jgi:WD40 repeat protein